MEKTQSKNVNSDSLCLIVVGMAGSGKTTFVSNFKNHLLENSDINTFVSNLDPVVMNVPYSCDYDIRKDFDHKKIMKKYKLGPNGAIMTCLNLFCSKIDKFIQQFESIQVNSSDQKVNFAKKSKPELTNEKSEIKEQKEKQKEEQKEPDSTDETPNVESSKIKNIYLIDTPGQIEAFMWSASGEIITKALSSSMPTAICFILDR
jgi:GTPase SAR1 family protein